ncbi:MAG: DegV family protein [Clostridia bacterium]|nr:DegV family protein [Clostridia bacterium]
MKVAISVESVHDLTKELLEKYDIKVIPYQINLADLSFKDGEYSTEEMFALVDKYNQLPKTTALNPVEYKEFFESLKKDYDAVVHICLSSGITSSCGNAIAAATELKDVFVVDSLALSTGIGLQAIYARELANAGVPAAEIAAKLNARRDKVQTSFVLERLDYMHKGGRCSSIALLGANLLKIRPRIVLKNGKMLSDKKYRGNMQMVVAKYAEELFHEFDSPDLSRVFITYTTATPEMVAAAKEKCQSVGFKEILETHAGGTIASHCGAHTIGILYYNDGEKLQ